MPKSDRVGGRREFRGEGCPRLLRGCSDRAMVIHGCFPLLSGHRRCVYVDKGGKHSPSRGKPQSAFLEAALSTERASVVKMAPRRAVHALVMGAGRVRP